MSRTASAPFGLALLVIAGSAGAADLRPPRALDTAGLIASPSPAPGCSVPHPVGPRRGAHLIVRDAPRPDVGPYTVQLPGYSTGAENLYRPFLLKANPGDTLRFDLLNRLPVGSTPPNDINLHTHGLIVSPRPCAPFGDSVYVEEAPNATGRYSITIPATLPGAQFAGGGPDTPYPPGLNWFHAHVHGKARIDVMAGQSGMLEVGDLLGTLRGVAGLTADAKAALNATDIVYLGLRDIQLSVPAGKTPDNPGAQGVVGQWLRADKYVPGACLAQANPAPVPPSTASFAGPGFCAHHGVGTATPDASRDTVWLFTVNGQKFPTLHTKPGRNQTWRIANLSANVSYLLELTADSDPATPLPMDVLSLDGLIAGTTPAGGSGLKVGVQLSHLLLMPAGRAEIYLPAPAPGAGSMTLRTAGITTGAQGDPWPRIDLLHIVPPPTPTASVTASLQRRAQPPAAPSGFPSITIPRATSVAPAARLAQAAQEPPNCITLPAGQTVRRRITFANDATGALFLLGSEVVKPDGTPLDAAHTIAPQQFPAAAMSAPGSVPHVCPRLGEQEVWELVNTTGELHNFHIHQSKFRLAAASDPGVPQGPLTIQDPTNIVATYVPEAQGATPDASVDVWHDTLPVPPADVNGHPGRVFVTIPFHAREQVGFFVFHCHILEHEDGGMMAVVQVFDPAHPQLSAELTPSGSMAMTQ